MIQFWAVVILYFKASDLGDMQFLYIDMFLIIPLSLTMSGSGPYKALYHKLPTERLMSFNILTSTIAQTMLMLIFLVISYVTLISQDWYEEIEIKRNVSRSDENAKGDDNTVVFLTSLMQYIFVVQVFSIGKPFRKPIYKNYLL